MLELVLQQPNFFEDLPLSGLSLRDHDIQVPLVLLQLLDVLALFFEASFQPFVLANVEIDLLLGLLKLLLMALRRLLEVFLLVFLLAR